MQSFPLARESAPSLVFGRDSKAGRGVRKVLLGGKDKGQFRGAPLDDVGLGGGTKQKESILCDWLGGAHLAFWVCLCARVPNSLQHHGL